MIVGLACAFTRQIRECELVVPHRANSDGTFLSYSLPQFYRRTISRRKREIQQEDHKKHYVMTIEGIPHHVELWPNHGMMSPNLVIEHRSPNISEVKARLAQDQQCHYVGQVRGHKDSRASLSVCDGLAGYVRVRRSQYYIEPAKSSKPKEDGQQLHLVHRAADHKVNASHPTRRRSNCDSGGYDLFEDCEATAEFVDIFNNIFDSLNSRSILQKGYKCAFSPKTEVFIKDFLSKAESYIMQLLTTSSLDSSVLHSRKKTGFLGFLVCIRSCLGLYKYLVLSEQHKLKYLLLYKFSQDHLEVLFSAIRRRDGDINNPTAAQFKAAYQRLLVRQEVKEADSGNCIALDLINILSASSSEPSSDLQCHAILAVSQDRVADIPLIPGFDRDYCTHPAFEQVSPYVSDVTYRYIAGFVRSIQRRSESRHRFVETSLVVDKKFITYHKDRDIENYILTLFNMVTTLYHDNSIGNAVDVILTRIIYLEKEEEEIDLEISRDAGKTLSSFCTWVFGLNPEERSNPHHFDVSVLLTRYDICSNNMNQCSLLGLAYTAAACSPSRGCSINEDVGLLTGNTIAHGMGHNLGCTHDIPERNGCTNQAKDNSYYVMSPYVMMNTNSWSECSKKYMTIFFETGLGDCLLNEPVESSFRIPDMPPGALYDGTFQCQERFGKQADICPLSGDRMCKQLLCKVGKFCVGSGIAPADGTRCGENQWCFDTKCVEAGKRIEAIHGHWGSWGPWSECSRTCGGGIESQERDCDNPRPRHRGRYCVGERKRSRICNIGFCDLKAPSFREVQCAEYNGKKNGKIWKPYWPQNRDSNPCELHCINEKSAVEMMDIRVKDGTRCRVGTRDTCVSGRCRKVGCDWKLDSEEIEDECGICKGNGAGCRLVEATFSETRGQGYETIVRIPEGSTKINIREVKSSGNLIAIKDKKEKYLLNGDRKEQPDGQYSFGDDVIGVYTHVEPKKEELIIKGPTDRELILQTLFTGSINPGIKYSFFQRGSNASYHPVYDWEFIEWSDCSAHCGGGTQVSIKKCVCLWRAGDWGPCSPSGNQVRDVDCVKENAELAGEDIVSDTKLCKGKRPFSTQKCAVNQTQGVYKSPALKPNAKAQYTSGDECPPVEDSIGPDTFKFIQVPLIDSNETAGISEEAEEEIGDMLSHKIDLEKMVIYTGDEADKRTKEVRNKMQEDA
ncbi:A disintegrin and metalloproteinase with thrombospondin motifs 12-like [Anabrus simplex]|uniref:A disintegrin and metalloproteinase with thrombospondin motifs 12-like n=1 Tax=Anabrus simplex TaxID=316456 RepID=UPI0035A396FF